MTSPAGGKSSNANSGSGGGGGGGGGGTTATAVATIAQKAKRKISLPWFRQSSVTPPHPALARQHTIDTPGSFHARLLRLQPSLSQVLTLYTPPSNIHAHTYRERGREEGFIERARQRGVPPKERAAPQQPVRLRSPPGMREREGCCGIFRGGCREREIHTYTCCSYRPFALVPGRWG